MGEIMEELKLSPSELKEIIAQGKIVGSGEYGIVFTYKDRLIKLDRYVYEIIRQNHARWLNEELDKYYEYGRRYLFDPEQIEELVKRQKNVRLTRLPEGILSFRDTSSRVMEFNPGIIIPYHRGYHKLEELDPHDTKTVLIILKKLLMIAQELENNEICQEDIAQYEDFEIEKRHYNILYRGTTPQMIDMSGYFVRVGNEFYSAKNMYRDLSKLILDYFFFNNISTDMRITRDSIETYELDAELVREFEEKTRRL